MILLDSRDFNNFDNSDEFVQDLYDEAMFRIAQQFEEKYKDSEFFIIERFVARWNGSYENTIPIYKSSIQEVLNIIGNFDEIIIEEEQYFTVHGLHHDGRNKYLIKDPSSYIKKELLKIIEDRGEIKDYNIFDTPPSKLRKDQLLEILKEMI